MTRYSDNIYSGFQATTSAASSKSPVTLRKIHRFSQPAAGGAVAQTLSGTLPPGVENLTATVFVLQQSTSATTSDKITVSAGGTTLFTIDQIGSATGVAGSTTTSFARFTYVASACAIPPVPSGATNGGEIPYSVTYLPVSASKSTDYKLVLHFNRADTNTLGITA